MKSVDFQPLQTVSNILKQHQIEFALGGSGLLAYYGYSLDINDWDLTTNADINVVKNALTSINYTIMKPEGIFVSDFLIKVEISKTTIDIIGGFKINRDNDIFEIPTIVTKYWNEVPIGCPNAWIKAYQLMGRDKKACFLKNAIKV